MINLKTRISALVAVGAVAGLALVPLGTTVSAATTDTEDATVSVLVGSTITIDTVTPTANIVNAVPDSGTPGSVAQTVTVSTNNSTGYTLTLSMVSSDANNGNLVGTGSNVAVITPVATTGALANNTWGYNTTGGTSSFSAVPASGSAVTLKNTATPVSGEATSVTYGAQITSALPSDTYSNDVTYTATVNP